MPVVRRVLSCMGVLFDAIAVATTLGYAATAPMAWKGYGNPGGGGRLVRMSRPHASTTQVVEKIIHLRETDQFGPIKMSMHLEGRRGSRAAQRRCVAAGFRLIACTAGGNGHRYANPQ